MGYPSSSVVITGASRGIGKETALYFAKETDRPLLLLARSQDDLEETKAACEKARASRVVYFTCDLTEETSVSQIDLPDEFPKPGIIINNAGSFLLKSLEETSTDEFRKEIDVNLFSAIHTTNRFLRDLRSLNRGLIINICLVGALQGLKDSGAYSASKHALLGYTRSLREELKETNIGVTAINLGQTQSTSWEGSDVDPELLIDPKDVAKLILSFTELSNRTLVEEVLVQPQHGRVPPM